MSPVVNTFPQRLGEIKVEPNLDKKDLWHGNKSAVGDSDVIVIPSDSESESKPRAKKEDVKLRLKEPTGRAKPERKGALECLTDYVAQLRSVPRRPFG